MITTEFTQAHMHRLLEGVSLLSLSNLPGLPGRGPLTPEKVFLTALRRIAADEQRRYTASSWISRMTKWRDPNDAPATAREARKKQRMAEARARAARMFRALYQLCLDVVRTRDHEFEGEFISEDEALDAVSVLLGYLFQHEGADWPGHRG